MEIVGASLTAETVSRNDRLAVSTPSLTVTVMLEVPVRFAAGAMRIVRLVPVPEKVILDTGTRVTLVEVAVSVRLLIELSTSATVRGTLSGVSSAVVWFAMTLSVGAFG